MKELRTGVYMDEEGELLAVLNISPFYFWMDSGPPGPTGMYTTSDGTTDNINELEYLGEL